jgi:hypothetical protein
VRIQVDTPAKLAPAMDRLGRAFGRAPAAAVARTSAEVKEELRRQVRAAGLGEGVARAWRDKRYDRDKDTGEPAEVALVYTRAKPIIRGFEEGSLIRSRKGRALAIPTDAAGIGPGGRHMTPALFRRARGLPLREVWPRGRRFGMLVSVGARLDARGRAAGRRAGSGRLGRKPAFGPQIVVFWLVPQARLPRRLDVAGVRARAGAALRGALAAEIAGGSIPGSKAT